MKKLLILPFLFVAIVSFGQQNLNDTSETFGYVNGIRMDSIKSYYAEVYYKSWPVKKTTSADSQYPALSNSPMIVCFRYGKVKSNEEVAVKDSIGNYISIDGGYAQLLNFLQFNGWELFKIIYNDCSNGSFYSVVKKISGK